MSNEYTIYGADGLYARTVIMPDLENLLLNLEENESWVAGRQSKLSFLKDGSVHVMSPPPEGDFWAFDPVRQVWKDPRTVAKKETDFRESVRLRRDQAINAGIVINGIPLHTDERSRNNIMGAAMAAILAPDYSVAWKGADGVFVTLSGPQVIAVAQAIRAHVQSCFDREAALLDDLTAGRSLDLEAGWPA